MAAKRRSIKRTPSKAGRSLNEILIDLGRQALIEGVKGVLVDHGIDSDVKVGVQLVKGRKPATKRATKKRPARRAR